MTDGQTMLNRINKVRVSKDELLQLTEAYNASRREHPDRDTEMAGMYLAVAHAGNDSDRALALWARLSALALALRDGGAAPGWTLDKAEDGSYLVNHALLEAAASEPLTEGAVEWVFDVARLRERALRV